MLRGRGLPSHGGDGRTDGWTTTVCISLVSPRGEREGGGGVDREESLSSPPFGGLRSNYRPITVIDGFIDCICILYRDFYRWIYGLYMYFIQGFLGFVIDGFMDCICILYRDF